MPAESARRWTAREVRAVIATNPLATPRYELVSGDLLVTPSPSASHQKAISELFRVLLPYLEREPVGVLITSPSDVELEPEFIAQPDMCIVPTVEWHRVMTEGFPVRELLLAIEILSPSSGHHDRVRKRPFYQRHVPDYWIVDLDARLFERWTPADTRPEVLTEALQWRPVGAETTLTIAIPKFFASIFER